MQTREVTIITGGASGIGRAIAIYFLKKGRHVAILDIDKEAAQKALEIFEQINPSGDIKALFFQCDVSKEEEIKTSVAAVVQKLGRIDTLINNAATSANTPLGELSLDEWNRTLAVNLTGPFLCAQACAPFLKKSGGSIINIGSTRATMSEPGTEAYSASKGGLVSLTHAFSQSLAPEVRANCISPGWIDTRRYSEKAHEALTERDHLQHPAGRVGEPNDVASLAWFLASDESGFITGQNWTVDGGMTKKMIYE